MKYDIVGSGCALLAALLCAGCGGKEKTAAEKPAGEQAAAAAATSAAAATAAQLLPENMPTNVVPPAPESLLAPPAIPPAPLPPAAAPAPAATNAPPFASEMEEGTNTTVITCDGRMLIDQKKRFLELERNVLVKDARGQIRADGVHADLDENNKLKFIRASGHVQIGQPDQDREAVASEATYDLKTGEIILFGKPRPRCRSGRDVGESDTIRFWREERQVTFEGSVRWVVHPGKGGESDRVFEK